MKPVDINAINPPQQTKASRIEASQPKISDLPKLSLEESDQVKVSGITDHVGRLVARAKGFDDVRQERVESLRQLVVSGQYHVSSHQIAYAILREEN